MKLLGWGRVNFNSLSVQDLGQGRRVGGKADICSGSAVQGNLDPPAAERNWLLQGLRAERRRQASGWASEEPDCYHVCHVSCTPPRESRIDLKVTKRHSADMRQGRQRFRGRQIGQDGGECGKADVTRWFFLCDVWFCAVLWEGPGKGEGLTQWRVRT